MRDEPCGDHYNNIGLNFKYPTYMFHGKELMFQYLNIRAFSNIRVIREWPNTDTTHLFEVDALVQRPHQADTLVPMTGYATFVTGTTNNCPALCNESIVPTQHLLDS